MRPKKPDKTRVILIAQKTENVIEMIFSTYWITVWCKHSVLTPFPVWNSLPFPYFFLTWWTTFPTNFIWNCVKSFYLQRIFQNIGYKRTWFFNNLVLSVFELSYIFHTFENMKFPTFSWLFDPFPNPSWLCQPIPYLFQALKNLNLIPDFFKIFLTRGNPASNEFVYMWYCVFLHMPCYSHVFVIWRHVR